MALTDENIRTMLQAVAPEAWRSVVVDGTAQSRQWLTILEYSVPGGSTHTFGLLDDGTWSALYADHTRVVVPDNRVPFFPLLEDPWRETARRIEAAVQTVGLPAKVAWSFPLDATVLLALRSSEYWREKALRWIDDDYPLTDEIAALAPRAQRVRARHLERMFLVFGNCQEALRHEFEASDGSFLIKLRTHLEWDKNSFNRLTELMLQYLRERPPDAPIPRWVAEGFWFLDGWVRDWSSHPCFPKHHGDEYYAAAYERLHDLAYWLFTGASPYEGASGFDPL